MITAGLLLLADGRFPAGGHAHSAGTEAAVAVGDVRDPASLDRYLRARLATTGRVDGSFAAAACSLAGSDIDADIDVRLGRLDVEYSARMPSPYLRDVSRRLGRQLVRAARHTWRTPALDGIARTPAGPHHPIALGVAASAAGATPDDAAVLAVHHLAGAVASAAIRLLGLDPFDVVDVQRTATEWSVDLLLVERPWDVVDPADLPADGGSLAEILGEHHGSLDARLFVA